jgi:hypothetical protein
MMMIKPNFFIVGAPKCGTTALYAYLKQHPQIFLPDAKEPNYFGRRTLTGRQHTEETYLNLFQNAGDARFVGEASPLSMVCETAAQEMYDLSPGAKIIAMVRDPFEMLRSLHGQCLLNSDENIVDFATALDAEADRRLGKRIPSTCGDTARLLYRRCARFSDQIERYINVFGRDRVLVIVFDDFTSDPDGMYSEVLAFLGADPYHLPEYIRINQSKRLRSPMFGRLSKRIRGASFVRFIAYALLTSNIRTGISNIYSSVEGKLNKIPYDRPAISRDVEEKLRADLASEVKSLSRIINRDLSQLWHIGTPTVGLKEKLEDNRC